MTCTPLPAYKRERSAVRHDDALMTSMRAVKYSSETLGVGRPTERASGTTEDVARCPGPSSTCVTSISSLVIFQWPTCICRSILKEKYMLLKIAT